MTTTRSRQKESHPTVIVEPNGAETNGAYQLQRDVILVLQDGTGRLLGLNRGQFYGLNLVGTKMLMLLLQQGVESAVQQVAQDYQVAEAQVQADITAFLRNLQRQRLITPSGSTTDAAQMPSRFRVFLLLALAWFSIRLLGWTKTIQLWRRWHCLEQPSIAPNQQAAIIQAVDEAVQSAASQFWLLPIACKERALTGWQLLRNCGLAADLVIGIEFYPFSAHAWVECNTTVITDEPAHCQQFIAAKRYR
jgi:hypothetical protein